MVAGASLIRYTGNSTRLVDCAKSVAFDLFPREERVQVHLARPHSAAVLARPRQLTSQHAADAVTNTKASWAWSLTEEQSRKHRCGARDEI